MVITDTRELDCMIVVETAPNSKLFQVLSVVLCSSFSKTPPVNALNPSSRNSMPNRNMETPAAISLKSGLTQNPYASISMMVGRIIFLSIAIFSCRALVPIQIKVLREIFFIQVI